MPNCAWNINSDCTCNDCNENYKRADDLAIKSRTEYYKLKGYCYECKVKLTKPKYRSWMTHCFKCYFKLKEKKKPNEQGDFVDSDSEN